jgi:hypothetical protein
MPNPLYNVPGLGGYIGQQEINQQRESQGLENAQRFQTLQQRMTDFGRQQAFHREIANLPPDQQNMGSYMGIAARHGSPTDIMHYGGQREAALARLVQTHQMAMLNYEQRRKSFTSLDDKRKLDMQAMAWDRDLRRQVAQYGLPPDTVIPPFQPPQDEGGQTGATPAAQRQWTQPTSEQVPPQDQAAYQSVLANAKAGIPSSEYGQGGPAPQPEQPPASPQPMDDQQREMYLLAQRAQAPQGGAMEGPGGPPAAMGPQGPMIGGVGEPTPLDMRSMADWAGLGGGMPQEISALPPRDQAKWTQERQRQIGSLPGADAARKMAYEWLYFGKEPPGGFGAIGQPTRNLVRNIGAHIAEQLGLSSSEAAMLPYDNKIKTKALGNLVNWGATAARSADKLGRDLQVALSYAQKLPMAQIQLINRGIIAGLKEFNHPDANAYASAINSVRMEYARLMSGPTSNAMLPVEAMKTSNELVSRGVNVAALAEVGRQMQKDANNTIKATNDQIGSLRESVTNVGKTPLFKESPEGPRSAGSNPREVSHGGKKYTFPTPAAAEAFRKEMGI